MGSKEKITSLEDKITALNQENVELKHSNEIYQLKLNYAKQLENKPTSPPENKKPQFFVPANTIKVTPPIEFNQPAEPRINQIKSAKPAINNKGKESPRQSKQINNDRDQANSKWIKVVGKSAQLEPEPMIEGYDSPMEALENVISNLEGSNMSKYANINPPPNNISKPVPNKESNIKEDYIINLFSQTIEESQENNGFFELHKVEAPKDLGKGKKEPLYVEPVRNKEERAKLKGQVCNECKQVLN
jgi:hypothetical protein